MKVKTFWLILLKIIGLALVIQGVSLITYSISVLTISGNIQETMIMYILGTILTVIFYFLILWLFVFKTTWLIDKLSLEKGFEEEKIEINAKQSNILSIAIIVIGGIILIDSLPQLCTQIFVFFQQKSLWVENTTTSWIFLYFGKAILGYILMTNSKPIVAFINKRTAGNNESDTEKMTE